ncbi:PQQ-binding-like beta-propeller repeat protein [Streptomyces violaceoruber]|uniref:outer membrane protein assembly factor BamB family protein n=1 Tax=Streptomyces violaceoruber TaxID=1935 RepID=UPI001F27ED40|nr:PQQ-binding-like beta-propeller repeat protein [Streptomyces violaceoruber]MCF3169724.1 PQQ-binding-like beta-propeller repeat protein [Streptomyces violaceoruber]
MSQPPSQQPPQGGFGAPQEPPNGAPQPPQGPPQTPPSGAPGYGYPQQPPAQPGYGYPQQQPGQAPGPYGQQPGPYGQQPGPYGQQAPGPYGQPAPGPYGQPASGPYGQQPQGGYGYPTQQYPGAPGPGGPGSGGGFLKNKTGIVVAAALAVVLIAGTGTWLLLSGDDDPKKPVANTSNDPKPPSGSATPDEGDGNGDGREGNDDLNAGRKPGEAKVAWLQKNDVDVPRNGASVQGPWFAGDVVAKAMYRSVSGYSVADGKQKWTIPLPADVCAAPTDPTADGKIVIGVKDGTTDKSKCSVLQMIDLNTGKPGWKKSVKQNGTWDFLSDIGLAISGDTVAVGRTGNANAYRVSDGKELFGNPSGNCKPYAFAGGPKLIAAVNCRTGDAENPQEQVQELDPASGKPKWTYQPPRGWEISKVYSTTPLVIRLDHEKKKQWAIAALTDAGKLRSQLAPAKGDTLTADCGRDFAIFGKKLDGCSGVAADADTFYMATKDDTSGTARTNKIIAFDLNNGKPKWDAPAPAERVLKPLGMEGGELLLYMQPKYDAAGAVVTLPPTGGTPKTLLQHPESAGRIENGFFSSKVLYRDGRSYVFSTRVSASNDKEEMEQATMLVFSK